MESGKQDTRITDSNTYLWKSQIRSFKAGLAPGFEEWLIFSVGLQFSYVHIYAVWVFNQGTSGCLIKGQGRPLVCRYEPFLGFDNFLVFWCLFMHYVFLLGGRAGLKCHDVTFRTEK